MIHAGLVCLNGPVGMDLDMQIKLFETALDELDQNSDLINQVLEITLDDANDAEFTIVRYELPTLPFPFPEGAARRTPRSPVRAARAVTRCWGEPSLGDDLVQNLRMALKSRGRVDLKKGVNNER
jgi:hypothetical protein